MAAEAPLSSLSSAMPPFPGFSVPRQNWFKMPNDWTNLTAHMSSLAEMKVVEYVLKHTWGYREFGLHKLISTDEFMHGRRRKDGSRIDMGTGLSKPSVIAGIKSAIADGFLEELVDDRDRGRVKKYYALRMMDGYDFDVDYAVVLGDDGGDDDGDDDDEGDRYDDGDDEGDGGGLRDDPGVRRWAGSARGRAGSPGAASAPRGGGGRSAPPASPNPRPRRPTTGPARAEQAAGTAVLAAAASGVKHPTPDVKNLYPPVKDFDPPVKNFDIDVKELDINCQNSLHRSEKDSLDRQQQTDTLQQQQQAADAPDANDGANDVVVVAADLQARGIALSVAQRLARAYPRAYIAQKVAYLAFLLETRPNEVKKPAAWLRKAIEDDFAAPDGFDRPARANQYTQPENVRIWADLAAWQASYARPEDAEDADGEDNGEDASEDERVAPAAQAGADWARLHAQHGTTPTEIALWEEVRADLSYGDRGVYASIADAGMLHVADDRVVLGIPQPAQMRRLEHPFFRAAIQRAFKRHLRMLPALELVAIYTAESEPAAVQAALTLG